MNGVCLKACVAVALLGVLARAQTGSGACTMHMYLAQDKVNGACGQYYAQVPSAVNGGFITAWRDLPAENKAGCGVCIRVTSTTTSRSTHVLVVDRGGAMGLDLSQSAIEAIDPGWATAGHTPCQWEVVASTNCQGASSNPSVGGGVSTPSLPPNTNTGSQPISGPGPAAPTGAIHPGPGPDQHQPGQTSTTTGIGVGPDQHTPLTTMRQPDRIGAHPAAADGRRTGLGALMGYGQNLVRGLMRRFGGARAGPATAAGSHPRS